MRYVYAHMAAFMEGHKVRPILLSEEALTFFNSPQVPSSKLVDRLLHQAFKYGQNDFQPSSEYRSVSAGDVLDVGDGGLHLVCRIGFKKITLEQFQEYMKLPRRDRQFCDLIKDSDE